MWYLAVKHPWVFLAMATNVIQPGCRGGILSNMASPVACTGGDYTIGLMFSDAVQDTDCPKRPNGFVKRVFNITGKQLIDGAGVLHAGALRVKRIRVMDQGMCPGVIGIKEMTPCGSGRALPSATRTTLTNAYGMIAGHHITGCGTSESIINLHEGLGKSIPGCIYLAPTDSEEEQNKSNHLTCKWADWIGTESKDISWACIESSDSNNEPIIGIPLAGTEVDCLSKFAAELYKGQQLSKVQACFGPTAQVVKTASGLPMLRIMGSDGLKKVQAAKAQLAANMAPAWMHHGFQVAHYAPEGAVINPASICKVTFERCTDKSKNVPVTLHNVATDCNIQVALSQAQGVDTAESLAQQLEHLVVVGNLNEQVAAVTQATMSAPIQIVSVGGATA